MSFKSVVSAVLVSVFTFGFSFAKSPKIALVLSGGGAKGFAEIPLLEALENEGIRPDMVLGTSMGALIGSLYAAGYTPKQIRQTLLSMDFMTILNERPSTPEKIPPEAFSKKTDGITFSFSIADGKFGSAPGIIGDQQIICELSNHLSRVLAITDFDKLPIPFRAIGTDAISGRELIFKSGSLVNAVRASISIPAVFTPAQVEKGLYSMDGGLRNNLPLKLAREMGADIVISMDVASIVDTPPETLSDFYSVAVQIFNLIISYNAVEQYSYADIVLRPDLSEFSTFDFMKPHQIVRAGEICVQQNKDKISQIARQIESAGRTLEKLDYNRESEYNKMPDFSIDKIVVKDISFSKPVPIPAKKEFEKFLGKTLDDKTKKRLTKKLSRLKEHYHLSSLTYSLKQNEDNYTTLEILANHYDKNMNQIFFTGTSSVSVASYKPQQYLSVDPNFTAGVFLRTPIESLFRLSFGNAMIFETEFFPKLANFKNSMLSLDFKNSLKYGSCSPATNIYFNDRTIAEDRGIELFGGIRFRHTDYFTAKAGIAYSAEKLIATEKWHNTSYLHSEIIFTTLHNDYASLYGGRLESIFNFGGKTDDMQNDLIYDFRFSAEKRFELADEKNSIGISSVFCSNRFPYELNSGYCNFGGADGMSGYPTGALRRDFAIAGISFRQKITNLSGIPLLAVAEAKAAVSSGYDPFIDKDSPSGKLFADRKFEAGGELYLVLHTILGNLVFGGSMNSSLEWCITLGLR